MLIFVLLLFFPFAAETSAATLPQGPRAVKEAILKQVYTWDITLYEGDPEVHWTNWNEVAFVGKTFVYGQDLEALISQELAKLIERKKSLMVAGKTYFVRYTTGNNQPVTLTDDYTPSVLWGSGAKFEVKVDFFKYFLPILWPEAKWVEAFSEGNMFDKVNTPLWATANGAPPYCWLSKLTNGFLYLPCDMLAYGGRFVVYDKDRKVLADVSSGPELSIQPALETSATRAIKAQARSNEGVYGFKIVIKGLPGRFLSLEWSPDLKNWQELTKLVADGAGNAETYDSSVESKGFYRVKVISTSP